MPRNMPDPNAMDPAELEKIKRQLDSGVMPKGLPGLGGGKLPGLGKSLGGGGLPGLGSPFGKKKKKK